MTEQKFDKNTWQTPKYVFNWLNNIYRFDIDGCASAENALCYEFIDKKFDFLTCSMRGFQNSCEKESLNIYVNPPYSDPLPFVKRAGELKELGHLVVMLLPADKSTEWFHLVEQYATDLFDIVGYRDEKGDFHSGRIKFLNPLTGEEAGGNNKGSMVAVFNPNLTGFVQRPVRIDFIKHCGSNYGKQ